ncbi:hypothetical protein N7510_009596 [Penicillium lagena]|uniref:uncharacterized protein n=1 Tax=Penicillium lagena TaxID=94218 RepID=UPI0025413B96|nr:uncharacterized protein N7510_009596 [Penicillium lagena]KAJ5604442.1 hypothetical protein N7510_009596 [Penicillium lagena]
MQNSVLLYVTVDRPAIEISHLVDALNEPNRQFTAVYNLPDVIEVAPHAHQMIIGAPVSSLVALQLDWAEEHHISSVTNHNVSLFIVADELSLPTVLPRTVQVVYLVENSDSTETRFESLRTLVPDAIKVFTTIDGGQQGWDEFMDLARSNGGSSLN